MHLKKIVFVRHGVTDWNKGALFQGSSDTPLNAEGRAQAQLAALRLASFSPDIICASPLSRAQETAQIIHAEAGNEKPFCLNEDLREMSFGCWEGLAVAAIEKEHGEHFSRWEQAPFNHVPEGGECWESISERASRFVSELIALKQRKIVVVAHGGILRALFSTLLGLDTADFFWNVRIDNCSLTTFVLYPQKTQLLYLNDTHHLRAEKSALQGRSLMV